MKRNDHIQLLIERFFEATATKEEERELKRLLSDPDLQSTKEIEEARAVMGYTALQAAIAKPAQRQPRRHILPKISAAAAVATLLIGFGLHSRITNEEPATFAAVYNDGTVETSVDDAMAVMMAQLGSFGEDDEMDRADDAFKLLDTMLTPD